MPIGTLELLALMRQQPYAVQASVSDDGTPQAALVGVVVSDQFEIFFDTLVSSRKAINLRSHPVAALVMGPMSADTVTTVQVEGPADEPHGADLERLLDLYFARFPDGRDRRRQPDITYWRIRPSWIRYSDFSTDPPRIEELSLPDRG